MKFISTSEGKKAILVFLFLFFTVMVVKAAVITSVATGFWNSSSTWDCNCVPGNGTDVVIATGTTVTLNGISTLYRTKALIIEANATFSNGFNNIIKVKGDYILNGTHSGTGVIELEGMFALVDGTGVITNPTDILINRNVTIPASANITKTTGSIIINGNKIITNYGVVTISTGSLEGTSTGSSWINDVGSTLNVAQNILSMGILTADAVGNTVHYTGTANQNITLPQTSYYDLLISGSGTKFQPANLIVTNSLTLAGGVFSLNTFDLNIAGNWINTGGTHDATNGTVFF